MGVARQQKEGSGLHQLNPQDAQFLYVESSRNLTHVTSVSIFDPSTVPRKRKVRFTRIIEHFRERLVASPQFYRRIYRLPLEMDFPYWVEDEHFDLEYHMHHARLPEPGDWRQFCIHMARYHSKPLDMNRPPWEVSVIEGLDNIEGLNPGCYAIAIKVHHAAVDGTSLMRFFASLTDSDNKGTPLLPVEAPPESTASTPTTNDMIRRAIGNNLRSPLRLANAAIKSLPLLASASKWPFNDHTKARFAVPETRFNTTLSPHKMVDARVFPLSDLREIRRLHEGVTVNDVVLAICAGGLRKYLLKHRELPTESLVAWVPINTRPEGKDGKDIPGNNISALNTPIFTDVKNPVSRLKKIMTATSKSKEAKAGVSARIMTDVSKHIPAATQVMASKLMMTSGTAPRLCNLFVSNVPGPQIPLYMNGAKMVRAMGLAPLADGMGLFIGTPSYNGEMSFNVISTREVLPDIQFFMECLESAKDELLALARKVHPGASSSS